MALFDDIYGEAQPGFVLVPPVNRGDRVRWRGEGDHPASPWYRRDAAHAEALGALWQRRAGLGSLFAGGESFAGLDGVGEDLPNRAADMLATQAVLRETGHLDPERQDRPTPHLTQATVDALTAFQLDNGLEADGWWAPDGETHRALKQEIDRKIGEPRFPGLPGSKMGVEGPVEPRPANAQDPGPRFPGLPGSGMGVEGPVDLHPVVGHGNWGGLGWGGRRKVGPLELYTESDLAVPAVDALDKSFYWHDVAADLALQKLKRDVEQGTRPRHEAYADYLRELMKSDHALVTDTRQEKVQNDPSAGTMEKAPLGKRKITKSYFEERAELLDELATQTTNDPLFRRRIDRMNLKQLVDFTDSEEKRRRRNKEWSNVGRSVP